MDFFFQPPTKHLLAALFLVVAVSSAWRGTRLLLRGLRRADHPSGSLWVVRGIRGGIVAVAMGALAAGVLYDETWLLTFGFLFLGEELYETGAVSLVLRAGETGRCVQAGHASDISS
jgi:hypothetical protein